MIATAKLTCRNTRKSVKKGREIGKSFLEKRGPPYKGGINQKEAMRKGEGIAHSQREREKGCGSLLKRFFARTRVGI